MRFKDSNRNMFSISGDELDENKNWIQDYGEIAAIVEKALSEVLHETYAFCPQSIYVKRYMHKKNGESYDPIPYPEMIKDDIHYWDHYWDYTCCERKMLAKLYEDFTIKHKPYPDFIQLFSRLVICKNCREGINEYKKNAKAKIIEYVFPK